MGPRPLCSVVTALCVLVLMYVTPTSGQAVNVALNKPINALYTCGTYGTERFATLEDATDFRHDGRNRKCYKESFIPPGSTLEQYVHPARLMVDGDLETWWQSTSRMNLYKSGNLFQSERAANLEALIDVDLLQEFLVESISLQLGDALTPQRLAILKSLDGLHFESWIFGVSDLSMCQDNFAVNIGTEPASLTDTICVPYEANDLPPGDTIEISITSVPLSLKEWTRIRYLKIQFYDMLFISPYNYLAHSYNHYAVRELTVVAECPCNGQQIGCETSNVTGMYECVCAGNTMGRFCENCEPMFNQFPFTFGQDCVECNCFNHADSCIYQASVDSKNESVNTQGVYSGGGRCVECQHKTAGINCDQCMVMHYRPAGKVQTDEDACAPCACNSSGSALNPDNGLMDCVMNDNSPHPDGKLPGDCYCKTNVQGSKCDECKVGFYNLDRSNAEGCTSCGCYTPGTVDGSDLCTSDAMGQCTCKANVKERSCNECKDGFYGLKDTNVDGCDPCDCDVGGAVDQVCNTFSGQCVCRNENIFERGCDRIRPGYFIPSPHHVSAEMEDSFGDITWQRNQQLTGFSGQGYAVGDTGDSFSVLLKVPEATTFSHEYILQMQYRTDPQNLESSSVTLTLEAGELSWTMAVTLLVCDTTWCVENFGLFNLSVGPNLISVQVDSGQQLLLDKLIAVPREFDPIDPSLGITLPAGCDLVSNTLPSDPTLASACQKAIFSVTMYYWGAPLQCNCHVMGSSSVECDFYGGQCQCTPNVVGRTCGTCAVGHYSLTSTGCTACNCDEVSTVCDSLTGQCECPDNAVGQQCDLCLADHWGWDNVLGCQSCDCDPEGSQSSQCDATTGVCSCKEGSQGEKCDQCQDNFFHAEGQGCVPCGCDEAGSVGPVCNKTSGVCDCKSLVNGTKCDTCLPGTFDLHVNNTEGCLECVCMGVTSDCQASSVRLLQTLYPLVNSDGNGTETSNLNLYTEDGTLYTDVSIVPTPDEGGTMGLQIDLESGQPRLYWGLPDDVVTNLLDLYKTNIEFKAIYVIVGGLTLEDLRAVIVLRDGTSYTHSLRRFSQETETPVNVLLDESEWVQSGVGTPLTRQQFLKVLALAEMILIPASFGSGRHTSRLSSLMYSKKDPSGEFNTNVEQCDCGLEYTGSSCQNCASGLKRVNVSSSEYLGVCAPCECNGHSNTCDQDSGVCTNCDHNTGGPSCELCDVGYYGDATQGTESDCSSCLCHQPRVKNGTCEPVLQPDNTTLVTCLYCEDGYEDTLCDKCSTFYYGNPEVQGGMCSPCDCNGNSEVCDVITGGCDSCGFNTTGNNCQLCNANFYGNASMQSCQACDCAPDTSDATQCDEVTGQCPCAPGVTGRMCDQCMQGYWGFDNVNFRGCQSCNCVEAGSSAIQCDDTTAQCQCKASTLGVTCDTCVDGYYGLPLSSCQACSCNPDGTQVNTVCDKASGQCQCKTGVTGRSCDQCLPFFVDFSDTGCTECGQCQRSLEGNIDTLTETGNAVLAKAIDVLAIQAEDERLLRVSAQLEESLNSLGLADNVTSLSDQVDEASKTLDDLSDDFSATSTQVDSLYMTLEVMDDNSQIQLVRHSTMKETAMYLDSNVTEFEETMKSYIQYLVVYNTSASQEVAKYLSQGSNSTGLTLSLDTELTTADTLLAKIEDDSTRVPTNEQIENQAIEVVTLESIVSDQSTNVEEQSVKLTQASDELNKATYMSSVVDNAVGEGLLYKSQSEKLVQALDEILTSAETKNAEILSTLTNARRSKSNTETIYSGTASTVVTGDDVPTFPSEITNYQTGVTRVENLLTSLPILVDRVVSAIELSEEHVVSLEADLTTLNSTFEAMDETGSDAVKAIDNYNEVVIDLDSAVEQSQEADTLIKEVNSTISGPAFDALQSEYDQEKTSSEALLEDFLALDYQPSVLQSLLETAETRLDEEPAKWDAVDLELESVTASAQELNAKMSGNNLLTDMSSAENQVQTALAKSQSALDTAITQTDVVTQKETQLELIQTQSARITELDGTIRQELVSHDANLQAYQSQMNQATALSGSNDATRESISNKIQLLEDKLNDVENMLAQLKEPVNFDGALGLSLTNPEADVPHAYDDLTVDVKKPGDFSDGIILFVDGATTDAHLEVGIEMDKFFMEFNSGSELVRVDSPAEVCADCWARVYASRYLATGHLTVQLMSTGGSVSTSVTGQDTTSAKTMLLTSPVYLGTLPSTVETTKVTNTTFRGCLQVVIYQNTEYNLWSTILPSEQTADCCQSPPALPGPSVISGVSFGGFGHLVLGSPTNLDFSQVTRLSLEMRTSLADAFIFNVISGDGRTKYFLGLEDGKVVWQITTDGLVYSLQSQRATYAAMTWIRIETRIEASVLRLSVSEIDNPATDVVTLEKPFMDLSPLTGLNLNFGTDSDPLAVGYILSSNNFAGCMRNVQVTTTVVVNINFNDNVQSNVAVVTDGCYENVIPGYRSDSPSAFMTLAVSDQMSVLRTIEISFVTELPKGILLYIHPVDAARYLYVAVFGGHLVVLYRQDNTGSVVTTDHYVSDGQLHTLKLDCSTLRVSLSVDGKTFEEGQQSLSSNFLTFQTTSVFFLEGVREGIAMEANLPVRTSLVGGISSLLLNDVEILPDKRVDSQDVSLAGIPQPSATTPAPPIPDHPVLEPCAADLRPIYLPLNQGAQLDGSHYIDWSVMVPESTLEGLLDGSFILQIDFAAYKEDGILFYTADANSNPSQYVALYLHNGKITFKVRTNRGAQSVQLDLTYNDGQRYSLQCMRINDFLSANVETRRDVKTNGVSSEIASVLTIPSGQGMYVGGLDPSQLATAPLPPEWINDQSQAYLAGAIYALNLKNDNNTEDLVLSDLDRSEFPAVAQTVVYGVSLSGDSSYLSFGTVDIQNEAVITLDFTTNSESAILFALFEVSNSRYIVLDMTQQTIRLHLYPSYNGITEPLMLELLTASGICDNQPHSLELHLLNRQVSISIDDGARSATQTIPLSHAIVPVSGYQFYVGGAPPATVPEDTVETSSLKGCVQTVSYHNVAETAIVYDPTAYVTEVSGATYSCPV